MNERVRKLAEQADRWAQEMTWSADPRYGDRPRSDLFEEKFAELIVRECADVARGWTDVYVVEDTAPRQIDEFIKKEFGVEE